MAFMLKMCFKTKYLIVPLILISFRKIMIVRSEKLSGEKGAVKYTITNMLENTTDPEGYQNPYEVKSDILHSAKGRSRALPKRWPKTGVPIFYEDTFNAEHECLLKIAFGRISKYSCIPIKYFMVDGTCARNGSIKRCLMEGNTAWTEDKVKENFPNPAVLADHAVITSINGSGCYSSDLGKVDSKQMINLDASCFWNGYGSAVHELLHLLGFNHEHTRHDRDGIIKVLEGNVRENALFNFQKYDPDFFEDFGPYDIYSLMHYSAYAFTKRRGQKTIIVNDPAGDIQYSRVGQRVDLTTQDKTKIRALTSCSGKTYEDHLAAVVKIDKDDLNDATEKALECKKLRL